MRCFHWGLLLVLSLFQQFSIILGGQENFIRQGASSLIVAEMCGNINTNESASSNAGRMGLMLIQPQLLSSIQRSFFLPCSAATATPSRSSFRRRRAISGSRWSCNGYRCALRSIDRRAMLCVTYLMDSILWSSCNAFIG